LYHIMDRITLAQYIGVSRASLYRAFEKNKKYQF
jgi:DNA-binding XRE family transcriptional regulator